MGASQEKEKKMQELLDQRQRDERFVAAVAPRMPPPDDDDDARLAWALEVLQDLGAVHCWRGGAADALLRIDVLQPRCYWDVCNALRLLPPTGGSAGLFRARGGAWLRFRWVQCLGTPDGEERVLLPQDPTGVLVGQPFHLEWRLALRFGAPFAARLRAACDAFVAERAPVRCAPRIPYFERLTTAPALLFYLGVEEITHCDALLPAAGAPAFGATLRAGGDKRPCAVQFPPNAHRFFPSFFLQTAAEFLGSDLPPDDAPLACNWLGLPLLRRVRAGVVVTVREALLATQPPDAPIVAYEILQ